MRSEPEEGIDFGVITKADLAMLAACARAGGAQEIDYSGHYLDEDDN